VTVSWLKYQDCARMLRRLTPTYFIAVRYMLWHISVLLTMTLPILFSACPTLFAANIWTNKCTCNTYIMTNNALKICSAANRSPFSSLLIVTKYFQCILHTLRWFLLNDKSCSLTTIVITATAHNTDNKGHLFVTVFALCPCTKTDLKCFIPRSLSCSQITM